jgi:hypothetical protein
MGKGAAPLAKRDPDDLAMSAIAIACGSDMKDNMELKYRTSLARQRSNADGP